MIDAKRISDAMDRLEKLVTERRMDKAKIALSKLMDLRFADVEKGHVALVKKLRKSEHGECGDCQRRRLGVSRVSDSEVCRFGELRGERSRI